MGSRTIEREGIFPPSSADALTSSILARIHEHLTILSAAFLCFQIEDCLDRHQSSLSPVANSSLICDLSVTRHVEKLQPTDKMIQGAHTDNQAVSNSPWQHAGKQ